MENKKVGVSQKAILYNSEGKMLTIRRSETSPTRALFWDLPGGILESGEDMKEAIAREIREETGLEVKNLSILDSGSWSEGDNFWVTICYAASVDSSEVKLSYEHDSFQWINPEEFEKIEKALDLHKNFVKAFQNT